MFEFGFGVPHLQGAPDTAHHAVLVYFVCGACGMENRCTFDFFSYGKQSRWGYYRSYYKTKASTGLNYHALDASCEDWARNFYQRVDAKSKEEAAEHARLFYVERMTQTVLACIGPHFGPITRQKRCSNRLGIVQNAAWRDEMPGSMMLLPTMYDVAPPTAQFSSRAPLLCWMKMNITRYISVPSCGSFHCHFVDQHFAQQIQINAKAKFPLLPDK
uniref:Uncharacterized protein n=1 Tax=Globodera rostochiensis TaxID=31243 RepID=A0A914HBK6_GLORO